MMSLVKNFSKVVLCTVLLLAGGCKDNDPFVNQGNVDNPGWVVTANNDMTSSMTAIVRVSFTEPAGILAAFIGDDCCGVAEYKAAYGLYWLYISPATEGGGNVQLRFYSPNLKRIFNATFPYCNDTQLGTFSNPYIPSWTVSQ